VKIVRGMKRQDRLEVFSPFTPADCASRLREAIDSGLRASLFGLGSKPVIGKVSESSVRLHRRTRYSNSFQTLLTAAMRPEQGGTVISGECAMHPFVRIFMVVWVCALAFIGVTLFLTVGWKALSGRSGDNREALLSVIIPLGMLAFGIGLVRFGRYLTRNDPQFLRDFLIQILDARPKGSA
jgi:hypothetical protein